jgi:hypothetical protein
MRFMANPLPPDVPQSFWDDYKKRIEADLAAILKDMAPLESGEIHLGSRTGAGPWGDLTRGWIIQRRCTIEKYEAILAALARKELP